MSPEGYKEMALSLGKARHRSLELFFGYSEPLMILVTRHKNQKWSWIHTSDIRPVEPSWIRGHIDMARDNSLYKSSGEMMVQLRKEASRPRGYGNGGSREFRMAVEDLARELT